MPKLLMGVFNLVCKETHLFFTFKEKLLQNREHKTCKRKDKSKEKPGIHKLDVCSLDWKFIIEKYIFFQKSTLGNDIDIAWKSVYMTNIAVR